MFPFAEQTTLDTSKNQPPSKEAQKRPKLWDLGDKHHCPVIGTCLTVDDLVRLAKRFGFRAHLRQAFELHVEAVAYAHSRNDVSIAMQRLLDRKFDAQLKHVGRFKSAEELLKYWKTNLEGGRVAGALWACYTHKACNDEVKQIMYGDVHMLSHQVGAGLAADTRRLAELAHENAQLKKTHHAEILALRKQHNQLLAKQQTMQQRITEFEATQYTNEIAQKRLQQFETGMVMIEMGQKLTSMQATIDHLNTVAQRAWSLEQALKEAHGELNKMVEERDTALAGQASMEQLLCAMSQTQCILSNSDDCADCQQLLSSRCVLYVGGRASMIAQYRQLADRLGIDLIHHDGGIEQALSRIPELIQGVDAVVCPTDQIGHSAYYLVKNHCKRIGKPCLFYQGTGVSSFAGAMNRIQRGEFTLLAQEG